MARPGFATLLDLIGMAGVLAAALAVTPLGAPTTANSLPSAIGGLGVYGYALLARLGVVPSVGNWALGLRRYHYQELEGFNGVGTLYAFEELGWSTVLMRVAAVAALVVGAFSVASV